MILRRPKMNQSTLSFIIKINPIVVTKCSKNQGSSKLRIALSNFNKLKKIVLLSLPDNLSIFAPQ